MAPSLVVRFCLFFFNDPATTEIYTLSLHDALPISGRPRGGRGRGRAPRARASRRRACPPEESRGGAGDRKSTRLNSSHEWISYAVFCLKKKRRGKFSSQNSPLVHYFFALPASQAEP